jgi:hypothetical protein
LSFIVDYPNDTILNALWHFNTLINKNTIKHINKYPSCFNASIGGGQSVGFDCTMKDILLDRKMLKKG